MILYLCAHNCPKHIDPIPRQFGGEPGSSCYEGRARRLVSGGAAGKNSADVKASYAHASIVGADRVVFNIKGNAYRLVVAVDYRRATVFIKWLGTHKQ